MYVLFDGTNIDMFSVISGFGCRYFLLFLNLRYEIENINKNIRL